MKQAAGILPVTADGKVLLLRRAQAEKDHAGEWAFPGGGVEDGETPEAAARREYTEETGKKHEGELALWSRRQADGVDFWTYIAIPEVEEFEPALNDEHDAHQWTKRSDALDKLPLHPGARTALLKFDMDELGLAKAIREGELVSPQRFGSMWLFALRITGTGAAYRPSLGEYVWRDKSLYLNARFVERCNGLPVILEHPPDGRPLDGEEFAKRIVGTIMLAYIQGDDVWGVARIYDPAVAQLLQEDDVSTSPCVVLSHADTQNKIPLDDNQHILIEGQPMLLDSVAIVGRGVWDQGGPPSGVQRADGTEATGDPISHEVPNMSDEKQSNATATDKVDGKVIAKADGAEQMEHGHDAMGDSAKLDSIIKHLDGLHAKHDALCGRMDAFDKKAVEGGDEKTEGEGAAGGEKKVEGEEGSGMAKPLVADAKKDGEEQTGGESDEKALEQERRENELARNDAAATALAVRVAGIEKRLAARDMPEEQRQKFVEVQARAERVALAFGDANGAPRWLTGETVLEYRRRLAAPYKKYARAWKDVDLSGLRDDVLGVAEEQILSDAMAAAARPTDMPAGVLREIHTQDQTGRRITRFIGSDDSAAWAPFTYGERRGRINTKVDQRH